VASSIGRGSDQMSPGPRQIRANGHQDADSCKSPRGGLFRGLWGPLRRLVRAFFATAMLLSPLGEDDQDPGLPKVARGVADRQHRPRRFLRRASFGHIPGALGFSHCRRNGRRGLGDARARPEKNRGRAAIPLGASKTKGREAAIPLRALAAGFRPSARTLCHA